MQEEGWFRIVFAVPQEKLHLGMYVDKWVQQLFNTSTVIIVTVISLEIRMYISGLQRLKEVLNTTANS